MRPIRHTHRDTRPRAGALTAPFAVIGSIALSLSAVPAYAEPRDADVRDDVAPTLRTARSAALAPTPSAPRSPATLALRGTHTPAPPTYTVQPGDTVTAIANRFGLRTVDVLALNGLGWRSVIRPGQVLVLTGGAAPAAPAPSAPAPTQPAASYTVQRGDTISGIAQRHGVRTDDVLAANGLTRASIIYPGQTIAIPGAAAPAPAPAPAPSAGGSYTVVAGDTISAIAQRHGVRTDDVLAANGLTRASIIYPGQTIAIPLAAVPASAPVVAGLDAEQVANAQLIIRIGRELGIPDRGIAIALGTAMQESWIRNLDWGDRDSLGLFQQRPSTGWGTAGEIRDAARSVRAFYGGASDPNGSRTRGLLDIPGWQDMSFADAAQAVQISAHPERYAQWEAPAYAWLAALG